jgi:tetratricopeptide (TPR) repeat protein
MRVAFNYFLNIKDLDNAKSYALQINQLYAGDKTNLAYLEQSLGNKNKSKKYMDDALIQLEDWLNMDNSDQRAYYSLSKIYVMKENFDKAFEFLDTMVDMGGLNYKGLMVDPAFDIIKKDSRYFKLIDRIKTIIDRERIEAGLVS